MKNVALAASTVLIAMTMVACAGDSPTSPSQVTSPFSAVTMNRAVDGGGQISMPRRVALSSSDTALAATEASANYTLMQLGMLAEQRGDRQEIKMFGRQLTQEFSEAQEQLGEIASNDALVQNARSDSDDQATMTTLRGLTGSQFDRAFVTAIIAELTSTRTSFQGLVASAGSSDYRNHASAMDSMVSRFQSMARDLDSYL